MAVMSSGYNHYDIQAKRLWKEGRKYGVGNRT